MNDVFPAVTESIQSSPWGGKDAVLAACREDDPNDTRHRLYIVDGDLGLLLGTSESLPKLFTLPVYCIENLLIDHSAALTILYEEDKELEVAELEKALDFATWVAVNDSLLLKLFIEYALIQVFLPQTTSVGHPVNRLVSRADGCVDIDKINARIEELRSQMIRAVGRTAYESARAAIAERVTSLGRDASLIACSGKDYLFPLFNLRMRSVTRISCTRESFKLRLARLCDISRLLPAIQQCEAQSSA